MNKKTTIFLKRISQINLESKHFMMSLILLLKLTSRKYWSKRKLKNSNILKQFKVRRISRYFAYRNPQWLRMTNVQHKSRRLLQLTKIMTMKKYSVQRIYQKSQGPRLKTLYQKQLINTNLTKQLIEEMIKK